MRTAEKTKTYQEYDTNSDQDNLRDHLLETFNSKEVTLPVGTVEITTTSDMILNHGFPQELLSLVAKATREDPYLFANQPDDEYHIYHHDQDMELSELSKLSTLEETEDGTFNISVLYGDTTSTSDEGLLPSAVLVYGEPAPEQIETLRAQLPEGVPLLNGHTNELLDDIGAEQREKSKFSAAHLGRAGLFGTLHEGEGFYSRSYNPYEDYDRTNADYDQQSKLFSDLFNAHFANGGGWSNHDKYGAQDGQKQQTRKEKTYPESEEVQEHRKRTGTAESLLNEAAFAKYGAESWRNLSPKEQMRVRNITLRDIHPDRGGNTELFQEVEFMTKDIPQPETQDPFTSAPETAEAETSSAAEPETPDEPKEEEQAAKTPQAISSATHNKE